MGSAISHQLTRVLIGEVSRPSYPLASIRQRTFSPFMTCTRTSTFDWYVYRGQVNEAGEPAVLHPSVPRAKLLELIASLLPCLIGREACSGAYHWAREFAKFDQTVRLMATRFVISYRLSVIAI